MQNDRNRISVLRQLAALQDMPLTELQEKWKDLYGNEPPRFKRSFLIKRLAYRIQELFYGGLSEESEKKLAEAAAKDPLCYLGEKSIAVEATYNRTGKILPGTRFVREWNGNRYEVIARRKGFEYDGRMFRSLSAIATEITGTRWNGRVWFGLRSTERRTGSSNSNR
jgi:hypothetical protein